MALFLSMPTPAVPGDRADEIVVRARRAYPRIAVRMRVVEIHGEVSYFQYATNLSEGGLFLEGCAPRAPGTRVTLIFSPPGSDMRLVAAAEVVSNIENPPRGTHLQFLEPQGSPLRVWLREYVHTQRPGR